MLSFPCLFVLSLSSQCLSLKPFSLYSTFKEMLEPEGRANLLKLAETYTVGVWMLKPRDPDALSVAKKLVAECGVSYVNTDFDHDFFSS